MKNRRKNLLNNSGSTLIIVIICIAFLSIISSLLLVTTVNSVQMKAVNKKSKSNFYSAEITLSEIRAGVEETAAVALEEAYQKVMENYLDVTIDKESLFAKTFINEIAKQLSDGSELTHYDTDKIASYIKNPDALSITISSLGENQLLIDGENPSKPKYIIIKNIHISYVDEMDYKTTLSTDIKISVPTIDIQAVSTGRNIYADYGLIADKSIILDTAKNVTIQGNSYAGEGGILLKNDSSLAMSQGTYIITRGNIEVADRSTLELQSKPNVWAKNILTSLSGGGDTNMPTTIQIEGNCYVENDLLLNAKNSHVKIKGEYYGYGNEPSPDKSSAVLINGLKSTLDLSGLSRLLIAGRAYLDPNSSGNQYGSTQGGIQTGESLAVKGNQYAYLVPSQCLWRDTSYDGVDTKPVSNPVSFDLYEKRLNNLDGLPEETPMVTLTEEIAKYANGYKAIFYNNGARKEVFFFLTFASAEKANDYLQNYYNEQLLLAESSMEARIMSFVNSVTVNTASSMILSPGHLLTYTDSKGMGLEEGSTAADGSSLESMSMNLRNRYQVLSQELSELSSGGAYDLSSVYRSLVEDTLIHSGIREYHVDGYTGFVVGGDFNTSPGMKGIIIASGDVTVDGNYSGMIIAAGNIKLLNEASVTASSQIVNQILNKNTELNSYLKNVNMSASESGGVLGRDRVVISDFIGYEGWKLNEE